MKAVPPLTVAYSSSYLKWQLGEGHPTNPVRARIALQLLRDLHPSLRQTYANTHTPSDVVSAASRVHDPDYVKRVVHDGDIGDEAPAPSPALGAAAAAMFSGTMELVNLMRERDYAPAVYFNPQGAKHHAMRDRASGFCALNDMAWAADLMIDDGRTVGYLDWDAHHGDGVEALCGDLGQVITYSIHQGGIFPGTGMRSVPERGIYNMPLNRGDGDRELLRGVVLALRTFHTWGVDVVLLAAGADGLAEDPLTGLEFTLPGLCKAARMVGNWAGGRGIPVLVGGAGGYTPYRETPMAWAGVVSTLQRRFEMVVT